MASRAKVASPSSETMSHRRASRLGSALDSTAWKALERRRRFHRGENGDAEDVSPFAVECASPVVSSSLLGSCFATHLHILKVWRTMAASGSDRLADTMAERESMFWERAPTCLKVRCPRFWSET